MNALVRGVRLIDPSRAVDATGMDLRIEQGRVTAAGRALDAAGLAVIDMTPRAGGSWRVLCPGFIDLHAHLREPGGEDAETIATGAGAAAAGGFTQVVAMANTEPPVDSAELVRDARRRARGSAVEVHPVSALTRGLRGAQVVDVEACAAAGAVAFSDDGRNAVTHGALVEGLRRGAAVSRPVLLHPEDEGALPSSGDGTATTRQSERPAAVEVAAIRQALKALREARVGHLHLQHVSTAESVALITTARREGLAVSAEVTPHHLSLWVPEDEQPRSDPLLKVNPPIRTRADRDALVSALRDGIIECVATDHAPHAASHKALPYADAAPGVVGLETALGACLTLGDLAGEWIPVLVTRLTAGPYRVLRSCGLLEEPSLRPGSRASCVLFDPDEEWTVGEQPLRSRSQNTPLLGMRLRGRVLLTLAAGRVVHSDPRLPLDMPAPAHA